jgi:arsenite-transporting ATPase
MTQFLLFGGKGGVGKTTCAAATALKLSSQGKTLIVSTDPAHSLSDSFETKLSGKEKEISTNLFAVEIDPKENLEKLKEKFGEAQAEMPQMPGMPGMDMGALTGGLGNLESMPGIDEMTAFDKFLQYMDTEEYEYIVFDTAPTGHTLKFLSLPDVMDSWVGKMLKMRMQLAGAMEMVKQLIPFTNKEGKDNSLENLEEMKKRIEKGKLILTNPNQTTFVLVMIPQEMAITESQRMVKELADQGIAVNKIVVNQIQPAFTACDFCKERRAMHEQKLKEIKKKFKKQEIKEIPLHKEEIKGKRKLEKFADLI